jgi:hypothetical protein
MLQRLKSLVNGSKKPLASQAERSYPFQSLVNADHLIFY